jgi:hypothetical protein
MKTTIAFLYRWTQLSTGMWYEGSRTRKGCHPEDGYICSSKTVKPMILKNKNDWVRNVLVIGESKYILELESTRLNQLDAKNDPMSFNMHNGDGKFSMLGRGGYKRPGIGGVKKKTSPWNKGLTKDDERVLSYSCNRSKNRKNSKTRSDKGREKTIGDNLPWKGIYVSPAGKEYLTTVSASKEHNVHRMTIFRWANAEKNGWKFIHKEKLGASELNEQTLFKGEI